MYKAVSNSEHRMLDPINNMRLIMTCTLEIVVGEKFVRNNCIYVKFVRIVHAGGVTGNERSCYSCSQDNRARRETLP